MKFKLGILSTHPIQYFSPWYRALAAHPEIDLSVYYAHRQSPQGQADAGFGVSFEWDRPLLEGYPYRFLKNVAHHPHTDHFFGCDTPEMAEIIARERFDAFLVGGWNVRSFWQAIRACWKSRTPLWVRGDSQLATPRAPWKRAAKFPLYRWFIPRFDGYLVVGRRAKEYLIHYGASEGKMVSVPHSVDNRFFAESCAALRAERSRWRESWGVPSEAVIFAFVGKLLPRKRPMDFLRGIEQAAQGSLRLWGLVVGDGPLRAELERYAEERRLPVRFTGFLNQSALPRAYAAADALVLPSDGSETWGLVVNEAMASGLPVIVSDAVGCGPDLVIPGQTGEVFPVGDSAALSAILKKWTGDPDGLQSLARAAREKIQDFSIERAVQGTVAAVHALGRKGGKFHERAGSRTSAGLPL